MRMPLVKPEEIAQAGVVILILVSVAQRTCWRFRDGRAGVKFLFSFAAVTAFSNSSTERTGWRLISSIMSPGWMLLAAAGLSGSTSVTTTPFLCFLGLEATGSLR